jgi:Ca2+-binding EF-hand superfamily protein
MHAQTFQEMMQAENPDKSEIIDITNFKRIIHRKKLVETITLDNLAKYLDEQNNGIISIGNLVAILLRTPIPDRADANDSTMRRTSKGFNATSSKSNFGATGYNQSLAATNKSFNASNSSYRKR